MKKHEIEQIDYLREKAGLTYEEALGLLEKNDGDLAQCVVELERQGRIRPEGNSERGAGRKARGAAFVLDWEGIKRVLFSRVSVRKGDLIVANLTMLAWLFVFFAAPWVFITGVIVTFLTGCKIKWNKGAADPNLDFHGFVGQAYGNIRRTADSVTAAVKSEDAPIATQEKE